VRLFTTGSVDTPSLVHEGTNRGTIDQIDLLQAYRRWGDHWAPSDAKMTVPWRNEFLRGHAPVIFDFPDLAVNPGS
jgi:hypothetical protein